jgi:hypothetical protein
MQHSERGRRAQRCFSPFSAHRHAPRCSWCWASAASLTSAARHAACREPRASCTAAVAPLAPAAAHGPLGLALFGSEWRRRRGDHEEISRRTPECRVLSCGCGGDGGAPHRVARSRRSVPPASAPSAPRQPPAHREPRRGRGQRRQAGQPQISCSQASPSAAPCETCSLAAAASDTGSQQTPLRGTFWLGRAWPRLAAGLRGSRTRELLGLHRRSQHARLTRLRDLARAELWGLPSLSWASKSASCSTGPRSCAPSHRSWTAFAARHSQQRSPTSVRGHVCLAAPQKERAIQVVRHGV